MPELSSVRTILLDIDGVLYRGNEVLPGGQALLDFCQQHTIGFMCLTNNGSMTPLQYVEKLAALGIHLEIGHILTSAMATSHYLRRLHLPGTMVYAIGMEGLEDALFGDGLLIREEQQPQVVVLGPDFAVTYEKLRRGCLAIRAGAEFVLTNPDTTLPTEHGLVPDAGALSGVLERATGVLPRVIGKPELAMFEIALDLTGGEAATTLMVGDRLETDIAGARNAGIASAMVLTGVSRREEIATSPHQPDFVFEDLEHLLEALREAYT